MSKLQEKVQALKNKVEGNKEAVSPLFEKEMTKLLKAHYRDVSESKLDKVMKIVDKVMTPAKMKESLGASSGKERKVPYNCTKCGSQVYQGKDVVSNDDYFAGCKNCDEDFYQFELIPQEKKEESLDSDEIEGKHQALRNILIKYGNPEYGDVIIDEICDLFGYPRTPTGEESFENDESEAVVKDEEFVTVYNKLRNKGMSHEDIMNTPIADLQKKLEEKEQLEEKVVKEVPKYKLDTKRLQGLVIEQPTTDPKEIHDLLINKYNMDIDVEEIKKFLATRKAI